MTCKTLLTVFTALGIFSTSSVVLADKHEGEHCPMKGAHMFKKMDTDNNGQISKEEHTAFHTKKFEDADADKNGSLSEDEAKAAMKKHHEHMKEKRDALKEKLEEKAE
jgi:hypothetical protein